jgi:hypothetical protein
MLLHSTTTIAAMLANAYILGVPCDRPQGRSIFIHPNLIVPQSLTPTPLQSTLPHYPYLDLIPIPSLRENLLKANEIIDVHEMWQDLSAGEVQVWGNTPWEEAAWEIGERFATKWWFLMDDEVLKSTNFWRGTRNERSLTSGAIKKKFRSRLLEDVGEVA